MTQPTLTTQLIQSIGTRPTAKACGVSPMTVHRWKKVGCLPRTELTGETQYAQTIISVANYPAEMRGPGIADLWREIGEVWAKRKGLRP